MAPSYAGSAFLFLQVTGFSNSEEAAVGMTDEVPFLLEDALKEQGGIYSAGPDWVSLYDSTKIRCVLRTFLILKIVLFSGRFTRIVSPLMSTLVACGV